MLQFIQSVTAAVKEARARQQAPELSADRPTRNGGLHPESRLGPVSQHTNAIETWQYQDCKGLWSPTLESRVAEWPAQSSTQRTYSVLGAIWFQSIRDYAAHQGGGPTTESDDHDYQPHKSVD